MPRPKTQNTLEDIVLVVVFSAMAAAILFACWAIGRSGVLPIF